ncbi:hypothetical protein [Acholeplasma laidlawii]|uniref:Uncharacterized protein n=2 Tax=Acholeplasma laidlawii TaxID=2148 RepID=A9NFW1_ACHLI|nr:hypothetical protein [Acholeplasma laidlawii]ABX81241.1 hypothetical protein ACL_0624 [Acholeplasma laidlawii PG-8A]NWH10186.1 hypothetical protein [Acholeplasma laidlawii]NWH11577.1 hypothetical protein [Acholeplasma laidlawii]NWH13014.1 hypothetical protein [Acholeplasma laidlawii]NWH14718.1 hypothetical protein [Acholeplasma laidlawii]
MAIIRVKRGTSVPTTSHLTQVGEMGFDTLNNELYIRGNSSVIKVGGGFTLLYEGTGFIPSTITSNNITLNRTINLYDKILTFEVRVVTSSDTYETHIVYGRMGTNSTTTASATYDRLYSWTTFDGQYFKTHSFKAYVSSIASNTMTVGYVKHLIGNFSGTSIAWTTNTTTTIYLERIWLVN